MADICKVIKDYGTIADHGGVMLKLKLIEWDNHPAKVDLRPWIKSIDPKTKQEKEIARNGITLTKDELRKLKELLNELKITPTVTPTVSVKEDKPISQMDTKVTEMTPPKDNIVQLPKPKPEIIKLITNGDATYEQCEEKIEAEKKKYVDSDSQYVLDGILELCKVDTDFRNNVMREDKHFGGALEYMMKMCRDGYGYKMGNVGFMDRDMGLGFTIDYFNSQPEEKKPVATATIKTEPKKRGRKKKGA